MTDAEIRLSHVIDDMEKMRTRSLRTLVVQADMLNLASAALNHGDLNVVAEYVDRVYTALLKEIDNLRADAG